MKGCVKEVYGLLMGAESYAPKDQRRCWEENKKEKNKKLRGGKGRLD